MTEVHRMSKSTSNCIAPLFCKPWLHELMSILCHNDCFCFTLRSLLDLVLEGNPLALLKNYKVIVKGFVPSLQKLDGERCKNLVKNGTAGYADGYKRRQTADMSDCDSKMTKSSLSIDTQSVKNDCSMYDANGESIYIDGWSSNTTNGEIDISVPARARSPVPWRNPPSLLPRGKS